MEELKERLHRLIETHALTDPEVVRLSQELDTLMNKDGGVLMNTEKENLEREVIFHAKAARAAEVKVEKLIKWLEEVMVFAPVLHRIHSEELIKECRE